MVKNIIVSKSDIFNDINLLRGWSDGKEASGKLGSAASGHRLMAQIHEEKGRLFEAKKEWENALTLYIQALEPLINDRLMEELKTRQLKTVVNHASWIVQATARFPWMTETAERYKRIKWIAEQLMSDGGRRALEQLFLMRT